MATHGVDTHRHHVQVCMRLMATVQTRASSVAHSTGHYSSVVMDIGIVLVALHWHPQAACKLKVRQMSQLQLQAVTAPLCNATPNYVSSAHAVCFGMAHFVFMHVCTAGSWMDASMQPPRPVAAHVLKWHATTPRTAPQPARTVARSLLRAQRRCQEHVRHVCEVVLHVGDRFFC